MMFGIPAHKQTDPDKYPGQHVNPICEAVDDMMEFGAEHNERLTAEEHQAAKFAAETVGILGDLEAIGKEYNINFDVIE
jgi:hypothetical protein